MAGLEISRTMIDGKPGLTVWGAPFGSRVLEVFFECDDDYHESLVGQEGWFRRLPRALKLRAKKEWPQAVDEFYMYRVCQASFDPPTQVGGGIIVFISRQVPQPDLIEEMRMFVWLMTRRVLV